MRPIHSLFPVVALALCVGVSACTAPREAAQEEVHETPSASEHHAVIEEILPQMPAADQQEQIWLHEQLVETGPEGLRVLLGYLTPPGLGGDAYARYAVSGLTKHVSRPGADTARQMVEDAMLDELVADRSVSVVIFLLHQLELIGSDRAVPVVAQLLADDALFEPAAEVLVAIQTPAAVQALQTALADVEEATRQEVFIEALGAVEVPSVAGDLLPYASAEVWHVRRAALYALARSGHPDATEPLATAADTTGAERQVEVRSFYLMLAERLAEEGHSAESIAIAREVLAGDAPTNTKHAALSALVQAGDEQALETLLDVVRRADPALRRGALGLVRTLPGAAVSEAALAELDGADAPVRADLIAMLGARGESDVLPALLPYLRDTDVRVRQSAVEAVARLGDEEEVPELMGTLQRAETEEEARTVETALLQMPTDPLLPAVAEAIPAASGEAQAALIRIVTARRGTEYLSIIADVPADAAVPARMAAYRAFQALGTADKLPVLAGFLATAGDDEECAAVQNALVAVLNRMQPSAAHDEAVQALWAEVADRQRPALIETLPRVGGDAALQLTVEAVGHDEPGVQEAALAALAEWPDADPQAAPVLLDAAADASAAKQRVALLQQYVRLVGASDAPNDEQQARLREAVATAQSPQEKARVIEQFTSVAHPVALRVVGAYLSDDEVVVRERARGVAVELLETLLDQDANPLQDAATRRALLELPASPELAHQFDLQDESRDEAASGSEESAARSDEAATALFNGEDLDGWEPVGGSSGGWAVDDGILYTDGSGHGWLSTTRTYSDFELELEFRVPEGGNSGVFLRAPREGNPAYQGMEIQVLDDYAEQYADLNAWQYTGSIYSVKAPSERVTKPAGTWQTMKIVADGPHIRVVLNGEPIVQTSLVNHMRHADEHPGLKRRAGYIGLQNHNTRVEYRNIVLREIE